MRRADAVLESYKQNRKLHIRRYVDRTEYIEVETWFLKLVSALPLVDGGWTEPLTVLALWHTRVQREQRVQGCEAQQNLRRYIGG